MSAQSEFRLIMKSEGKSAIEVMNEAGHHLAVENLAHADYLIYEAGEKLRDEEIAALRSELERYETARQEDARRLELVKGKRDEMREVLQVISEIAIDAQGDWHGVQIPYVPDQLIPFAKIEDEAAAALKDAK